MSRPDTVGASWHENELEEGRWGTWGLIMSEQERGDTQATPFGTMQRPSGIVCSLVVPVQLPRVDANSRARHGCEGHVRSPLGGLQSPEGRPSSVWWCEPDGSRRQAT